MASTSSTMANHSEIPPWKIELIQRKKKFGAISPNGSIQRTIMQFDSNDANSDKNQHCDANGLVAAKVHDYSLYSTSLLKVNSSNSNSNIGGGSQIVRHTAIQHIGNSSAQRSQMDGSAEHSGNSVAGHSHFQSATSTAAHTINSNSSTTNGSPNASIQPLKLPATVSVATAAINSVSSDALAQPNEMHEVGSTHSPQPLLRKSLEMVGVAHDKLKSPPTNQFHSRHASEHNTTASSDPSTPNTSSTSFSLVSDRKQQLEQKSGKCLQSANKLAILNQSQEQLTTTSTTPPTSTATKTSPIVQKYLQSSENRSSLPNWFPSKRNSLILLADQQLDFDEKKRYSESATGKMVAMQELATATTFDDSTEDLQYGPGIVSKLRCRYLSLALRQTVKQRPTLDNLRRANSMSNLLEEDNVDIDEVDDRNAHNNHNHNHNNNNSNGDSDAMSPCPPTIVDGKVHFDGSFDKYQPSQIDCNGKSSYNYCSNGKYDTQQMPCDGITAKSVKSNGSDSRCRQVQRGNDSLKRARSVEALMRYDTLAWRRDVLEDSEDYPSSNPIILDEIIVSDYQSTVIKAKTADSITIEDKIQQARDRMNDPKPPRRLTSFMSDTERPPPDLVKQTLLKFEATANRRNRASIQRYGNGDVAAKVATYKSKMSNDKSLSPPQITPKLPPSGFQAAKKPMIKPRTTSPKAAASVFNGTAKDQPQPLAKKPSATSIYTKTIEHESQDNHFNSQQMHHVPSPPQQFNGNGLKSDDVVERMNQRNASNTITPPIMYDTIGYRNVYEMITPESPVPPHVESPRSSYVYDMIRRRESPHTYSPIVNQLASKTENLLLNTPKTSRSAKTLANEIAFSTDSSVQPSDTDEIDDATSNSNSSETGWSESYDVNISDDNENGTATTTPMDEPFLAHKPPMPKPKHNGNQMKATVISVAPPPLPPTSSSSTNNCISNGSLEKKSDQPEPSVRQIGIIRPLNHEAKPPVPVARKLLSPPVNSSTTTKKDLADSIKVNVAAAPFVVSTQHSVVLPSSTSSVVVTNSVSVATSNDVQGDVVVIECTGDNLSKPLSPTSPSCAAASAAAAANNRTKSMNNTESNTISIDTRSIVHQKNLLNKEKTEEILNGNRSSGLMIQSPIKWNIKKSTVVSSSPVPTALSTVVVNRTPSPPAQPQSPLMPQQSTPKQRPSDIQTTNTMVFNFSNRKDVPDYIENDGLVIRRKRELPKPGESGFVLLGDLTVETSTDPEPDDSWICDPPSPCDVQFKNANVVINGKSSLRDKSRNDSKQLSIRFNDVLTSTFEYPSESSLCDDIGLTNVDSNFDDDDTDLLYSNGHFLGSSPIASVPLGNYTPIKIFNTNFELGVTRTHSTPSPQSTAHKYQAPPPPPPPRTHSNGKVKTIASSPPSAVATSNGPTDHHHQQLISIDSTMTTSNGSAGESDSLQYLKPANEDAVAWSEGASDLLF